MKASRYYEDFNLEEELEQFDNLPSIRNLPVIKVRPVANKIRPKPRPDPLQVQEIASQMDSEASFNFTYPASRHERWWLLDSLGGFYHDRWIDDITRIIKGGKEASVYHCISEKVERSQRRSVAAKVYRPRKLRNLRNDHLYREGRADLDIEGRQILDEGKQHAMRQKSSFGMELLHTSWIGHEFKTMQILHAGGCDVPEPYASGDNVILMEYIGGADSPAPTLNTVALDKGEARSLFERLVENLNRMLSLQRVHGDLSAYNVLYWEGDITLIDFPQAIHPEENRNAYTIFERDVTRTCEYFIRQGLPLRPRQLAADLWTSHRYRLTPEVHPRLLDEEDTRDRAYWQKMRSQEA